MTERLESQLTRVTNLLNNTSRSLPQRFYDLSEQNAYLLHLLQSSESSLDIGRLGRLQDDLATGLASAIEEDRYVREDETWGNTCSLLDFLAKISERPWRDPEPDPLETLARAAEILGAASSWDERLARLDAHPTLGSYERTAELFQGLEGSDSADVAAHMKSIKKAFGKREKLPETHWWTTQAPDWLGDWFSSQQ